MPTLITKTIANSGADYTPATIGAYLSTLDLKATDSQLLLYVTGNITWPNDVKLPSALAYDDTHRVTVLPAAGLGVNSLSKSVFDYPATGIEVTLTMGQYGLTIGCGIDFVDLKLLIVGAGGPVVFTAPIAASIGNQWNRCRIHDTSTAVSQSISPGANYGTFTMSDSLVVVDGAANRRFMWDTSGLNVMQRCTVVASGVAANTLEVVAASYNYTVSDTVFINCGTTLVNGGTAVNCYSNTTPTVGAVAGITVNVAAGGLVVNETSDFRPSAAGGLIGKGRAAYTLDILGNNRGASPDAGPWQLNPATPQPGATITNTVIDSATNNVTISGTTTGAPSSGYASLTPTVVTYNDGVAQSNVPVTLGSGTFTVTFPNAHVGQYNCVLTFTNSGGTAQASGASTINVLGAAGAITSQAIDGQQLTVSGTTTGNPSSGTIIVPPDATTPNGAIQQGPVAVTLGAGTFTAVIAMQPGNYAAPVVRFTTANGTGFPASGGNGFSVIGISGNPEAPPADTPPPTTTVTSVSVNPATVTLAGLATQQFSATVTGTNSPSQGVTWTSTAGSINSSGVLSAPAATSSAQTITVTATSLIDPSKSGSATVTIAAQAAGAAPTVTSVTVTPATTVLATNTTVQFAAQVLGTNSPSQAVIWSTSGGGGIDASGLFTRPAQTNTIQVITITATSVLDPTKTGTATVTILALPITNERLDMAKLDATQYINLMPIGQSGKRLLTTLVDALIDDIKQLRDAQTLMAAKLDADAGVTDTNYSATATVPESKVILGK